MSNSTARAVVEEVDWDTPTAVPRSSGGGKFRDVERFQGVMGVTRRVAILTPRPLRTFSHYKKVPGAVRGFYISCLKGDGLECQPCAANERVTEKYGVNLLVYPQVADATGMWDPSQLKVVIWQFNNEIKNDISNLQPEWGPIINYDLTVTCTDENFGGKFSIGPCRDSLWRSHPMAQEIGASIQANLYDLNAVIGRKDTVDEVRRMWAGTATRDQIKAERKARRDAEKAASGGGGAPMPPQTAAAPTASFPTAFPVASTPPAPAAQAAMPNFRDLFGKR